MSSKITFNNNSNEELRAQIIENVTVAFRICADDPDRVHQEDGKAFRIVFGKDSGIDKYYAAIMYFTESGAKVNAYMKGEDMRTTEEALESLFAASAEALEQVRRRKFEGLLGELPSGGCFDKTPAV